MQVFQIDRTSTGLFSQQQIDLCYHQETYLPFIEHPFSLAAFEDQIEKKGKSFLPEQRTVLVKALKEQYKGLSDVTASMQHIEKLKFENTFTVVTGHQLVAYTGPLYFIYKILHVIKQTEQLKSHYPDFHFVPVYWMATEDHDYEEIKALKLFNQTLTWETNQHGPVGRFGLAGMEQLRAELHEAFKNHPDAPIHALIDSLDGTNYAHAFRQFVHRLFGKYGLVIIDGDDPLLKKEFSGLMKQELLTQFSSKAVEKTSTELERLGAKLQVHPREINLFYLAEGVRERIQFIDGRYVIEGIGSYSEAEIIDLLERDPTAFSPNVILRPLYQECILPNLNYVGGVGEISYWLQLKGVFDETPVLFPLIQVRNSAMFIDSGSHHKMQKLDLKIDQLFMDKAYLKNRLVKDENEEELDFSDLHKALRHLQLAVEKHTQEINPSLEKWAAAENVRLEKTIKQVEEKLFKSVKQQHDATLKQVDQLFDRVYPNGSLQERSTNFFQLTPDGNYESLLDTLLHHMEPFGHDLLVFVEV